MARYLFQGSCTAQGTVGREGAGRVKAVAQSIEGLGGRLEAFYWACSSDDFFVIADVSPGVSAIAAALIADVLAAPGVRATALITPAEPAARLTATCRPPAAASADAPGGLPDAVLRVRLY